MNCWEVIGFEEWVNEKGEQLRRIYAKRAFVPQDGHVGAGIETGRFYYKTQYVKYEPKIGHLIAVIEGRYGIDQIVVVGEV